MVLTAGSRSTTVHPGPGAERVTLEGPERGEAGTQTMHRDRDEAPEEPHEEDPPRHAPALRPRPGAAEPGELRGNFGRCGGHGESVPPAGGTPSPCVPAPGGYGARAMEYLAREILAWCLILLGTFFLAKAIVSKGQKWTMKELLGLRIDKLKAYRNHIIQRLEAAFGFFFVFCGVATHLYILLRKSVDKRPTEAYGQIAEYMAGTLVAIVVLAVAFHYVCKWVSRKSFVEILAYLVVRYRYRLADDQALLKEIGEVLHVEHRDDDTIESYTDRVEAAMGLEKVRARLQARNKPVELG